MYQTGKNRMLRNWRWRASALLIIVALVVGIKSASAGPRPIDDFLSAQGTFCLDTATFGEGPPCDLFLAPAPNMIGWSVGPAFEIFALVDYAGLYDRDLGTLFGTTMSGRINERPLADGRAEVAVVLHTKNALVWVSDISAAFPGPLVFGNPVENVIGGATPAFADCSLQVRFTNTAPGAPLPDLIQLAFVPDEGQAFEIESLRCTGKGLLADGSPALVSITQTGVFSTAGNGATADAFPAERIELRPIGK